MHFSLKRLFILVFIAFIVLSLGILALVSSSSISKIGNKYAGEQGERVCKQVSQLIDIDKFSKMVSSKTKTEYFDVLYDQLYNLARTSEVAYLYTMTKLPNGEYAYVVDGSDLPDSDGYSDFLEVIDLDGWGKIFYEAFKKPGTYISSIEYQQEWGYTVSVYKSIVDNSGKIIGVIGCDTDVGYLVNTMRGQVIRVVILSSIMILTGLLLLLFFTGKIFGQIKTVSNKLEIISSGTADLTQRIKISGNNELTTLADSCNKIMANMDSLMGTLKNQSTIFTETGDSLLTEMNNNVSSIRKTSEDVCEIDNRIREQGTMVDTIDGAVANVQSSLDNLNTSLKDQSTAIEESASAVKRIGACINNVTTSVGSVLEGYKELIASSESGAGIQAQVNDQVQQIAEQSSNLTKANKAIAAIAGQTNLLAMNAAIEAAHAGEAGKGFAVVADEIRGLAETSSKQSKEISKLLSGISGAIENIVSSSEISMKAFSDLNSKIGEIEKLMNGIQLGIDEENLEIANIFKSMETLTNTSTTINSTSVQIQDESLKVCDQVENLRGTVKTTVERSEKVAEGIDSLFNSIENSMESSKKNKEAAQKVSSIISGYRISEL